MCLQISFASTSVALSDRSVYRNFYRTVPSDALLVPAVAAIMDCFKWGQLSVLTEEQSQFLQVETNLVITVFALFNMQYYEKMRIVNSDIKSYYFSTELTKNFTDFANESAYVLVSAFSNANYTLLLL